MALGSQGASRMLGRWELISELAKGQLGALWAAHSDAGGGEHKVVMIRRVPTSPPVTPAEIDALSEGAWWCLEVQGDLIARGVDVVMTDGELGVAMAYTEGEVLRSLLRLASFKRRVIPVSLGLRIALDVLEGVNQAVGEAMPHTGGGSSYGFGGLGPDSVLVGSDGKARLLDVGIAGPATKVGPLSRHPEMAAYAAPEQLDDAKLDVRANLYAVGVMLWEMLSGKRLYVGSTHAAVADKVRAGSAPRLDAAKPVGGDAIPASVADAVEKAIATSADGRYGSIDEMAEALRSAADVASHEEVAALMEDLAGNTLKTRRKVIERATQGGGPPKPAVTAPKPPAPAPSPALAGGKRKPAKQTLLGIAPAAPTIAEASAPEPPKPAGPPPPPGRPPPPRPPMESLDSEVLEVISVVESVPGGAPGNVELKSLSEEAKAQAEGDSPKPPDAASPKPPEVASPKPPEATADAGSPKPPDATASEAKTEGAKVDDGVPPPPAFNDEFDATTKPPPNPFLAEASSGERLKTQLFGTPAAIDASKSADAGGDEADDDKAAAIASGDATDAVDAAAASGDDAEPGTAEEKKDDAGSAVAWIGPPPGEALDDDEAPAVDDDEPPPKSVIEERTEKNRKIVFMVVAGAAALLVVGLIVGALRKDDEGTAESKPTATADTAAATAAKPPEPKPEPTATATEEKKEEPPPEEEKKEEPPPEEEKKEEPVAAPAPKPKPVYTGKPVYRPQPKPKPKPKPTFTPKGI